jgi:transposase
MMIRARAILVETRTALINAARGLTKSYGERLPNCATYQMGRDQAESLSPAIGAALDPLLAEVETVTERIREYDKQLEQLSQTRYPETQRLKQVHGVGTLIALAFVLTVEDPHRFRKSRAVGCYVGLRPKRRQSGQSRPQLGISKEGDVYLRTLLVQGAHHVLGPFGKDSDLRRWGLKLAAQGGQNAKKRAVIAVARKLAVLLHKLWVSGETYEPLRLANRAQIVAA